MIGDYLTDKIRVISRTFDKWNQSTETSADYAARIEPTDRTVQDSDGTDRRARYMIMVGEDAVVPRDSRVKILELNGEPVTEDEYAVVANERLAGFGFSHREILVDAGGSV